MKIEKKVWPEYFQKIIDGVKKYEVRLNDFECHQGDELILKEWNPKTREYTGREVIKKVTYLVKTKDIKFWSESDIDKYGLQIISFE